MKIHPTLLVAVGLTALTSLFTACQTGSGSLESLATPARELPDPVAVLTAKARATRPAH